MATRFLSSCKATPGVMTLYTNHFTRKYFFMPSPPPLSLSLYTHTQIICCSMSGFVKLPEVSRQRHLCRYHPCIICLIACILLSGVLSRQSPGVAVQEGSFLGQLIPGLEIAAQRMRNNLSQGPYSPSGRVMAEWVAFSNQKDHEDFLLQRLS